VELVDLTVTAGWLSPNYFSLKHLQPGIDCWSYLCWVLAWGMLQTFEMVWHVVCNWPFYVLHVL